MIGVIYDVIDDDEEIKILFFVKKLLCLKKVCYDVSVKCLLICIVFESVFSKIFIISFI